MADPIVTPLIISLCVSAVSGIISYLMRPRTPDRSEAKQNTLVQVSSYGQTIPLVYGKIRIPGNVIWSPKILATEHTEEQEGGKGGGGGGYTYYTYSDRFAVMVAGNSTQVKKVWANDEVIRDVSKDCWKTNENGIYKYAVKNAGYYSVDVTSEYFVKDKGVTDQSIAYMKSISEIGISTGSNTSNTLNDTKKAWTANAHKYKYIKIHAGTGVGQAKEITSNTSTTITITGTWTTTPDATSKYWIYPYSTNDPSYPNAYLKPGYYVVNPDTGYGTGGGQYIINVPEDSDEGVTYGNLTIYYTVTYQYIDSKHTLAWYNGSWTQERSAYIYNLSTGYYSEVPAYRGRSYGVFVDMQLKDYGNVLPNCTWEVQDQIGVQRGLDVPVKYIVSDLCTKTGLTTNQFDCSTLTGTIRGISVAEETTRSILEKLGLCCSFEMVESGNKIKFVQCGQSSCATILESELVMSEDAENEGQYLTIERKYEHELPQRVTLQFLNYGDDERPSIVSSMRMNTTSKQVISLNMPVNMTFEQARTVTRVALRTAWVKRDTYKLKLSRKYWYLEPLDVITLNRNDGTTIDLKIMKMSDGRSGYIETEAVEEQSGEYL